MYLMSWQNRSAIIHTICPDTRTYDTMLPREYACRRSLGSITHLIKMWEENICTFVGLRT